LYPDPFGEVKMVEPAINHKTILFHHTLSNGVRMFCGEARRLLKEARSLAPLDSKIETSPPRFARARNMDDPRLSICGGKMRVTPYMLCEQSMTPQESSIRPRFVRRLFER
jgi:hypothetical protein